MISLANVRILWAKLDASNCDWTFRQDQRKRNARTSRRLSTQKSAIVDLISSFFRAKNASTGAKRALRSSQCSVGPSSRRIHPLPAISAKVASRWPCSGAMHTQTQCRFGARTSRRNAMRATACLQLCQSFKGQKQRLPVRSSRSTIFRFSFVLFLLRCNSTPASLSPGASEDLRSAHLLWRVRISGKSFHLR